MWSNFELKLQDAVFEVFDQQEKLKAPLTRRDSSSTDHEDWTAFVPELHQHRERNNSPIILLFAYAI